MPRVTSRDEPAESATARAVRGEAAGERVNARVPLPLPHFMAFAPLDCWARVLIARGAIARIHPRYWLRLAGVLATSALATALTLPERILLAPIVWSVGRRHERGRGGQGGARVLVVLGYYRSGTTHLHYLLSCDRRMVTPRWYQALAPQGFVLSWTFMRFFLVPFLSSKRPQDDVAYGPEYPAEDDFAVCNWTGACAMPGRMVLPGEWALYSKLHGQSGAPSRLRRLFSRTQAAFTWKLGVLNPGKTLLLKTPSHTARVDELVRLYGDRVRFIHVSREAEAVVRSNVAMHARFGAFLLQDHPGNQEIQRRVVEEYDATEKALLASAERLERGGGGRLVRIRYQDLIADPIAELRGAYETLGMGWTAELEARVLEYLETVRDYRTASQRASDNGSRDAQLAARMGEQVCVRLGWMREAFGHDRPARAAREDRGSVPASTTARAGARTGLLLPGLAGCGAAAAMVCVWLAWAWIAKARADAIIWPAGVAIGLAMLRTAGRGSTRIGLLAATLTLAAYLAAAMPSTLIAEYIHRDPIPWEHVWLSTRRGVMALNNFFWAGLGLLTAYRFGSREHVRPPGL